jgi:hypothetical protein
MTMIEQVARAISAEMSYPLGIKRVGYDGMESDSVRMALIQKTARAVIEAMRTPSEAMIGEGFCTSPDDDAVVVWQVMIDAALAEKPT